ncbi:MAG: hypothetical protein ABSC56_08135 [Solirubrobacteraceae bacterium]
MSDDDQVEELDLHDAVPAEELAVVESVRVLEPVRSGPPALVQAAAVAATGFVAGAATVAVLARRRTGQPLLAPRRSVSLPPAGDTQMFLVAVRTLRRPQGLAP